MPRVLIVEDDVDQRSFMEYLLQANGYETTCVSNGHEALAQMAVLVAPRWLGTAHYGTLSGAERDALFRIVGAYTRSFDLQYGTDLYGAMVRNGFKY